MNDYNEMLRRWWMPTDIDDLDFWNVKIGNDNALVCLNRN